MKKQKLIIVICDYIFTQLSTLPTTLFSWRTPCFGYGMDIDYQMNHSNHSSNVGVFHALLMSTQYRWRENLIYYFAVSWKTQSVRFDLFIVVHAVSLYICYLLQEREGWIALLLNFVIRSFSLKVLYANVIITEYDYFLSWFLLVRTFVYQRPRNPPPFSFFWRSFSKSSSLTQPLSKYGILVCLLFPSCYGFINILNMYF